MVDILAQIIQKKFYNVGLEASAAEHHQLMLQHSKLVRLSMPDMSTLVYFLRAKGKWVQFKRQYSQHFIFCII